MKRGTSRHPKMKIFARALGVSHPTAVGLLQLLWEFAGEFAPDGIIGKFSNSHIAEECGWDGDPDTLIAALTREDCRWIDPHETLRLVVHDWEDHCEDSTHCKLARARKWFFTGNAPKLTKLAKNERDIAEVFYQANRPCARRAHDVREKEHDIPPTCAQHAHEVLEKTACLNPSLPSPSLPLPLADAPPSGRLLQFPLDPVPEVPPVTEHHPETAQAVRVRFPDADDALVRLLVQKCVQEVLGAGKPAELVTDAAIAIAVATCTKPRQYSPMLYMTTVPQCLKNWANEEVTG